MRACPNLLASVTVSAVSTAEFTVRSAPTVLRETSSARCREAAMWRREPSSLPSSLLQIVISVYHGLLLALLIAGFLVRGTGQHFDCIIVRASPFVRLQSCS